MRKRRQDITTPAEPAASAVTTHRTNHLGRLIATHATPYLVWIGFYLLAVLVWLIWGTNDAARPWMPLLEFLAGGGICWVVIRGSHGRGEVLRVLAVVTTAAAIVWLIVATILGPFNRPIPDLYGGLGLAACVGWTVRRALMGEGTRIVGGTGPAGKLIEALQGARLGQPVTKTLDGGVVVETPIEVDRGNQTIADLQAQVARIEASIPGMRPGSLRIEGDDDDAGRGNLVAVPTDPLMGTAFWPGPSAPGQSVHLGAPVGPYQTGGIARIFLTGDERLDRNLAQWLVMGMSGAGKSSAMRMLVADLLSRVDFVCWAHDHVKGLQTLAPILGGLDWVTMDLAGGKRMLRAVREAIRARTDYLGRQGREQWEPGCGLSLLMVWLEEATDLGDFATLTQLVREARSVGIILFVSMQRASHSSVDTDTRSQFGGGWCFGVRDAVDGTFCLPELATDGGAEPERWGNSNAGYCYLTGPGIPTRLWSTPVRAYRATNDQLRQAVELGAQYRQPLDAVTAAAVAELGYDQRRPALSYLEEPATSSAPLAATSSASAGRPEADEPYDQTEDDDMPVDHDPHIKVDPARPVEPPETDLPLGQPYSGRPKLSTDQARAVVQEHLAAIYRQAGHTRAADLHRLQPATTRGREWVRLELVRLCTEAEPGEWSCERNPDDEPGVFHVVAPRTARDLAGARA